LALVAGSARRPRRILIVGSINADLVVHVPHLPAPGETVAGGRFEHYGGGKGANQAVAAARLGATVRFVGAVGEDDIGSDLRRELVEEGIDVSGLVSIPRAPSGVAVIIVDDFGENQIAVALGANDGLDATAVARLLARARPSPTDLCLIGGFEIPDAVIAGTARFASKAGLRLVCSPAPARSLGASAARELFAAHPILTPNEGEAMALSGKTNVRAAARELVARTQAPVVVTLGGRGAMIADGKRFDELPGFAVEVVDTTGAGDTFTGALAVELGRGVELRPAVRYALAAASLSVTVAGARGGSPTREVVDAFLREQRGV
jgi:ribokinase